MEDNRWVIYTTGISVFLFWVLFPPLQWLTIKLIPSVIFIVFPPFLILILFLFYSLSYSIVTEISDMKNNDCIKKFCYYTNLVMMIILGFSYIAAIIIGLISYPYLS